MGASGSIERRSVLEWHLTAAAVQRLLQPPERLVVREFEPAWCGGVRRQVISRHGTADRPIFGEEGQGGERTSNRAIIAL